MNKTVLILPTVFSVQNVIKDGYNKKTANLLVDFETVAHNRKKLFTKKLSTNKVSGSGVFFTTVTVCKSCQPITCSGGICPIISTDLNQLKT
jgi:hypothetical protein